MEELKDVADLFKTSIVEHFSEALLKSLCNLNSLDDYQNLDISLVYNLLRNVCKNVTPPKRGWGYEPSADDVSLGADIERIRSISNRYCDGKTEFFLYWFYNSDQSTSVIIPVSKTKFLHKMVS